MQLDVQSARNALRAKNFSLAAAQYQELISATPTDYILYLELSSTLMGLQKFDEALVVIKQIELVVSSIENEVKLQKGNIYLAQGRYLESIQILKDLIPGPCEDRARTSLSGAYIGLGLPSKAIALFNDLARDKLSIGDTNNLAISLCERMQTPDALEILRDRIALNNYDQSTISNLLMLSNYVAEPEKYIPIAKTEIEKFSEKIWPQKLSQSKKTLPRIGFISGDMNQHPVGWFFLGLLRELSKKYSILIYYTNNKTDQLTNDLISFSSEFYFVESLTDSDLINQIQSDKIDVLIDLSGHTANSRISIFNQRIAPVQLSYLGYFASTHALQMDGVIFDEWHLNNVSDEFFSETIYKLPCSRFCFTPPPYAPQPNPLPAITNGNITFCSFSSTLKINNECIEMWSKTLMAIPHSRIQLRWKTLRDQELRNNIRELFLSNGVTNSRVELYADCDHESLFHFYNEADIALDTYPFSGATTSCEALWMGLPVITRAGITPASNQSASILNEIHLGEYVTKSIDEFVKQATRLSNDLNKLSHLRATMRERISNSSLGDPKVFSAHFSTLIDDIYMKSK
jgi:protein O-GlcNAc transferase